jgi:hypothetical protein
MGNCGFSPRAFNSMNTQQKNLGKTALPVCMAPRRPSLVEMAELCCAVYGNNGCVTFNHGKSDVTWQRQNFWRAASFYAALYTREGSGRVLAFRGTDSLVSGDLVDDASIALGGVPPSAVLALQAPSMAGTNGLYLTGHSLGGALAIIAAARYNLPAVTFNAPGVMDSCVLSNIVPAPGQKKLWQLMTSVARCFLGSRMLNFRIGLDPVSSYFSTGLQSGVLTQVEGAPQCGFDLLCRHGKDSCRAAMRHRTDGFNELNI